MLNSFLIQFFLIFYRVYSFLLSEAKYKAKYGKDLKILTPK